MPHQFDAGLDANGRRRYLTVLFSDLSGSTRLGELMEAESYAETLLHFRQLCREIIPRHGGRIARIQGDGVLGFFGYPDTREDDGRRATQAALELHAAVSQLSVGGPGKSKEPLTMHSGIHAGLVLLADRDIERGRFEILGDVPKTAEPCWQALFRGSKGYTRCITSAALMS
ncbi:MAG: adenylate/guanylate cyclase domain-containing protein [Burkholderiales bacterium]|jgi:class 3 adenylate cyclase|nr:adenylate/guanylate cyclase domain-containing protein [Burkholderiales bacterium]